MSAVGRGAYELYDYVDFDSWFVSTLLPMAADASPDACVVRRRVAWVAGRWVSVKMGTEVRPQLYQLVLQLLSEGEDLVVRMTAAETLKLSVDDFDFRLEAFANMFEVGATANRSRLFGALAPLSTSHVVRAADRDGAV